MSHEDFIPPVQITQVEGFRGKLVQAVQTNNTIFREVVALEGRTKVQLTKKTIGDGTITMVYTIDESKPPEQTLSDVDVHMWERSDSPGEMERVRAQYSDDRLSYAIIALSPLQIEHEDPNDPDTNIANTYVRVLTVAFEDDHLTARLGIASDVNADLDEVRKSDLSQPITEQPQHVAGTDYTGEEDDYTESLRTFLPDVSVATADNTLVITLSSTDQAKGPAQTMRLPLILQKDALLSHSYTIQTLPENLLERLGFTIEQAA